MEFTSEPFFEGQNHKLLVFKTMVQKNDALGNLQPKSVSIQKKEKQWVPKTHLHTKLAQTNSPKLSEGELMDTALSLENLQATKSRPAQSHFQNLTGVGHVNT